MTVVLFVKFISCFGILIASAVAPDLASGAYATFLIAQIIEMKPNIDSYCKTGNDVEIK